MVRTEKGRVVYDRKLHEFSLKDLNRIYKKLFPKSVVVWVDDDLIKDVIREIALKLAQLPIDTRAVVPYSKVEKPTKTPELGPVKVDPLFEDRESLLIVSSKSNFVM